MIPKNVLFLFIAASALTGAQVSVNASDQAKGEA